MTEPRIRRFESLPVECMISAELEKAGLGPVKRQARSFHFVKIGRKSYTHSQLIKLVNELRIKRGLEPINLEKEPI